MKMYYMRDNHTFLHLPFDLGTALDLLREEFDAGYTYGMLCTTDDNNTPILHARGTDNAEEFFKDAETWIKDVIASRDNS